LDYSNEYFSKDCLDQNDLPAIQKLSPLLSPLCRRISNSSREDQDYGHQVDRQAEEFIAKFYEQLRLQNRMSLLQYQEMLDRGTA
jgi:fructose-1,6-bisphosphatase/inositol monophosphatase family enzyme